MLAIFPLNIVLFPESIIRLHIFEERYKNLINDCMANNTTFGVVPIVSSKFQKIGCNAKISEILKRYEDGRLDILIQGEQRFNLIDYMISDRLYYEANINFFDNSEEYPNFNLIEECLEIYNLIAEEIQSLNIEKIDAHKLITKVPSFLFAQKSGLTLEQKYKVLEMNSENERLKYILEHLEKMEPYLRETEYVNRIIKNDGYVKISNK